MEKALIILMATAMLMLAGCGSEEDDKMIVDAELVVGSDIIVVNSIQEGEDDEGNLNIIIDYTWTNNSDETTNWVSGVFEQLYQEGQELEMATIKNDDYENVMKNIRPGITLENIQRAFTPISKNDIELDIQLNQDDSEMTTIQIEYPQ